MKNNNSTGAAAPTKKHPVVVALILLAAAANCVWWFAASSPPPLPWAGFLSGARVSAAGAAAGEYGFFSVAPAAPDIYATGVVKSDRSAKVSPPVSGIVRRVVPERFAPVRSGDVLVELDDRQAGENLRRELAELDAARVRLLQARDQLQHLQSVRDRYVQLLAWGVASAMTVDEAAAGVLRQEHEVRMAEQDVAAREAAVGYLREQGGQTSIKSPIDGIVTDVFVTEGQFVAPGGGSDMAATLLVVSDTGELFAQLLVDEIDVSRIRVGQEIELKFDALPGSRAAGRIRKIAPAPNDAQGKPGVNFETAASIETPLPEVRVGMTVFAVMRDTRSGPRRIPSDAVLSDGDGTWVWQAEQGRARKKPVRVRDCSDGECVLAAGLEAGAVVVTGAAAALRGIAENQPLPSARD